MPTPDCNTCRQWQKVDAINDGDLYACYVPTVLGQQPEVIEWEDVDGIRTGPGIGECDCYERAE